MFASYVHVRAWIIMKINILVDRYTDSLSFEEPSIGCGEMAKTKPSMHICHFSTLALALARASVLEVKMRRDMWMCV